MELLKFDEKVSEWWWCRGEMWFGLVEGYVRFYVVESADYEYVKRIAEHVNNLPETVIEKLCKLSIAYCNTFNTYVGNPVLEFEHHRGILKLIHNIGVSIPNPDNENEPAFHVMMDCDREEEHGMSWAVKNHTILYVGPYTGDPENIDYFLKRTSSNYAVGLYLGEGDATRAG